MTLALAVLWKTTLVLLVAILAARAACRARAAVRHAILVAAFAAVACLPFAVWLLPAREIPVLPATDSRTGPTEPNPERVEGSGTSRFPSQVPEPDAAGSGTQTASMVELPRVLASVWAAGAALLTGSLIVGLVRVQRLRRSAIPYRDQRARLESLLSSTALHAPVDVVVHESVAAPITCGVWHMAIVLPPDVNDWEEPALARALLHEREHVRRRDWAVQVAVRAICGLYWFHPLAWMAYRQLCLEAEHACDDAVVTSEESTMYADQLVSLARRMAARPPLAVLGMAQRSDLAARVRAILDPSRTRGQAGLVRGSAIAAAAAVALLALAPLHLVAAPVGRATSGAPDPRGEPEARRAPLAAVAEQRLGRALVEAAQEGDRDDVESLLDAGAHVDAAVVGDGSPLIVASREGHIDVVRLLLARGANVNLPVSGDGNPLLMAAREGEIEIVSLLLDSGADIELIVPGDENALINASAAGHLDVVRLLVLRGANVNARVRATTVRGRGGQGITEMRTPLGMAIRGGHHTVAEFLRTNGATE